MLTFTAKLFRFRRTLTITGDEEGDHHQEEKKKPVQASKSRSLESEERMMNTSEEENTEQLKNEDEATAAVMMMMSGEDRGDQEIIIRDPLTKMYHQHQQQQANSMSPRIPRKEKRLLPTSYSKEVRENAVNIYDQLFHCFVYHF